MIEEWGWAEVAAKILGLPEETDEEVVEHHLLQEYGLDLEGFGNIAEKLLGMTAPMRTVLGNELVQAFVVNDDHGTRAIVKQEFKRD
ncbi:hypothetical protein ROCKET24_123 [Vibrio phage Rocket24]|uniref:Uncharacterized protein n=1 Tax=Vibrio phage Chester TaxID=2712961 RepID=A0A6G8R562_9CAUD|nr:hypothetical protein KNU88_gp178 [Vibrio phage Chester]QIG66229.1 hypothetical protein CILSICK_126 [Vibrio phage Cilsick]QIN96535.1 hypothetical protein CHESTER_128 [Vibrio phage Chester]WBU77111.1 hypothetical protein NOELLE_123 [Vibrio phage Noelle]WCD55800.1 hypothetical protein ROCKET24_123 [Vibrio phage Rocket24]